MVDYLVMYQKLWTMDRRLWTKEKNYELLTTNSQLKKTMDH